MAVIRATKKDLMQASLCMGDELSTYFNPAAAGCTKIVQMTRNPKFLWGLQTGLIMNFQNFGARKLGTVPFLASEFSLCAAGLFSSFLLKM